MPYPRLARLILPLTRFELPGAYRLFKKLVGNGRVDGLRRTNSSYDEGMINVGVAAIDDRSEKRAHPAGMQAPQDREGRGRVFSAVSASNL